MSVISLLSDEPEIIEILSSPPPTPIQPRVVKLRKVSDGVPVEAGRNALQTTSVNIPPDPPRLSFAKEAAFKSIVTQEATFRDPLPKQSISQPSSHSRWGGSGLSENVMKALMKQDECNNSDSQAKEFAASMAKYNSKNIFTLSSSEPGTPGTPNTPDSQSAKKRRRSPRRPLESPLRTNVMSPQTKPSLPGFMSKSDAVRIPISSATRTDTVPLDHTTPKPTMTQPALSEPTVPEPEVIEPEVIEPEVIELPKPVVKKRKPRRAVFKESTVADEPSAASRASGKAPTAASTVADRRKAASHLTCFVHSDDPAWIGEVREQLLALEVEVACSNTPGLSVEGVALVVTVIGTYDDEWSAEHGTFVKSSKHTEDLGANIAVLQPEFMDTVGSWSTDRRSAYFAELEREIALLSKNARAPLYMVPEIAVHFKRRVDKFNRELRKRVSGADTGKSNAATGAGGSVCDFFTIRKPSSNAPVAEAPMKPPDELFYVNLETQLQVQHQLKIHYPRKRIDCVEMIANCIVDFGFQRYHAHADQQTDTFSGSVRNKAVPKEIVAESLTKIQGLPPRIATKLANEVAGVGKLMDTLGSNTQMRESRIKLFGKGTWNASLLTFLECDDPDQII